MPGNEDEEDDVRPVPPLIGQAAEVREYDDADGHRYNELKMDEKLLLDNVLIHGMMYLLVNKGWTLTAAREFLQRAECMRYLKYNQDLYDNRKGVQERTQFYGQIRINAMVPSALAILTRALVGHQFDENGQLKQRAPDRGQFDAAMKVLECANIQGVKYAGDNSKPVVDARSVTVNVNTEVGKVKGLTPAGRSRITKLLTGVVQFVNEGGAAAERVTAGRVPAADDDGDEAPAPAEEAPAPKTPPAGPMRARTRPRNPRPTE